MHKGEIVKRLVFENADADFVICAGDDRTDDDMFRALAEMSATNPASSSPTIQRPASVGSPQKPVRPKGSWNEPHSPQAPEPELVDHNYAATSPRTTATPLDAAGATEQVSTNLRPESVFSIVIDSNPQRKTTARWRVDEPEQLINLIAEIAAVV